MQCVALTRRYLLLWLFLLLCLPLYDGTECACALHHCVPGKLTLDPLPTTPAHGFGLVRGREKVDNGIGKFDTTVSIHPYACHIIENRIVSPTTLTTDHRLAGGASFQV